MDEPVHAPSCDDEVKQVFDIDRVEIISDESEKPGDGIEGAALRIGGKRNTQSAVRIPPGENSIAQAFTKEIAVGKEIVGHIKRHGIGM